MGIDFSQDRWQRLGDVTDRWWAGELDRPLIAAWLHGRDPGRPAPALAGNVTAATYDLNVPAEQIVDVWDYNIRSQVFLGEAFPWEWCYMGPISSVTFFGAVPKADDSTVWFFPPVCKPIRQWRFAFDEADPWMNRALDICRAAMDRWAGRVCLGTTALASGLDVLSVFRPGEGLLTDLYDDPDEVKRCTAEVHEAFWRQWEAFDAVLAPVNPGFTCWVPIFSRRPYYTTQCDFAYMISPAMFDEFVLPDLAGVCRGLGRTFYHLDGVGQLPHLDSLLDIPELSGIQWVPGDGKPGLKEWPEVFRRVRQAGKLIQLYGGIDVLDAVADQLGSAKGIILLTGAHVSQEKHFVKALARYGVM